MPKAGKAEHEFRSVAFCGKLKALVGTGTTSLPMAEEPRLEEA